MSSDRVTHFLSIYPQLDPALVADVVAQVEASPEESMSAINDALRAICTVEDDGPVIAVPPQPHYEAAASRPAQETAPVQPPPPRAVKETNRNSPSLWRLLLNQFSSPSTPPVEGSSPVHDSPPLETDYADADDDNVPPAPPPAVDPPAPPPAPPPSASFDDIFARFVHEASMEVFAGDAKAVSS